MHSRCGAGAHGQALVAGHRHAGGLAGLCGPDATQLAIYISWPLHGVRGGVIAGVLFFLPSFLQLSAVVAVVLFAAGRIGSRALKNEVLRGIATLVFIGVFVFNIGFP